MPEHLAVTYDGDMAEVESLSREMADAYRRRIEWYRREYADKWAAAFTQRNHAIDEEFSRRAITDPPDQVSFDALQDLVGLDPAGVKPAWERVKAAARDDLACGHRAAIALEFLPTAWKRAQFLAIRAAPMEQWQAANAGEALLVDMLPQTYASYLAWVKELTVYSEGVKADVVLTQFADFVLTPPSG